MLVLHVRLRAKSDQEHDDFLPVTLAGDMQRCRQLRIHKIGFGPRTLQQEHQHVLMAQLGCFVEHGLPIGIIHVLLLDLVQVEEASRRGQVVGLDGLPEGLVHPTAILLKCSGVFIDHAGFLTHLSRLLHLLQGAVEGGGAHRSRHRIFIQHDLQVLVGRLIYLLLGDDGPRCHLVHDFLACTRPHSLFSATKSIFSI